MSRNFNFSESFFLNHVSHFQSIFLRFVHLNLIHQNESLHFCSIVAIDTETMGLNPARDRLCLVQLSSGNGICHLVKIIDLRKKPKNLLNLLNNSKVQKIFHFARFDVAVLKHTYFD